MANTAPIWAQPQGAPPPPIDTSGMDQTPLAKFAATASAPSSDQVFAPAPAPAVKLAPQPPSPEQQQISNDQQRLQKIRWEQENRWGTADNHPGKLGKIAHAFSMLGNIAGNIFVPGVMQNIEGTQMNRQMQEGGLAKRLNSEITDESQNAYRGAEQAKTEEETKEAPAEASSKEGLEGAQEQNLEHPNWEHLETDQGIFALNPKTNELMPLTYQGQPLTPRDKTAAKGMEHVSVLGPNGKPMEANFHPDTGKYTDSTGKEIANPTPYEKPNQAGMVTMIMPDPNNPGGGIVQRVGAGAHIAPGSQTTAGFNSMNTPTTNQRTAAGRAENVLAMVPEVTARIDAMHGQIGPEMGRWNDFMQGKVGTNNPEFAALRSDLLMMSSAVALAHAQGRLPENLREEFDRAINAPKQTPENLKATINAMVPWLQQVQTQGGRSGAQPTQVIPQGAPAAGTVENGFRFKGGNPADQKNWEKAQ